MRSARPRSRRSTTRSSVSSSTRSTRVGSSVRAASTAGLGLLLVLAGGCGGGKAGPLGAREAIAARTVEGFSVGDDNLHMLGSVDVVPLEQRRLADHSPWLAEGRSAGRISSYAFGTHLAEGEKGEPAQDVM